MDVTDRQTHLLQLHQVDSQQFREKLCVHITPLQGVTARKIKQWRTKFEYLEKR